MFSDRDPAAGERFQFCLKSSTQGVKFVKLKAKLTNVRCWNCESKCAEGGQPSGRRILAAAQLCQLWEPAVWLLLDLRDVKLDESVKEFGNLDLKK